MSGRNRPGSVSTNSRRQYNAELRGTYIPFRPFLQVGIDESDSTDSKNTNVKVEELRYQTITMLPEYRDKSLDELRFEDYQANRHCVRQQVSATVTLPTSVPTFPPTVGRVVNNLNNFFNALRSQFSNLDNLGTNIQFQPVIAMDIISKTIRNSEVRYQTVSVMPEYCNKSVEELRLEDYTANRLHGRQRPASASFRRPLFRFGENINVLLAAQSFQFSNFDFSRSQPQPFVADGSFSFPPNDTNRGAGNRTTTVVPENRDNSSEVLRREEAAANSQQAAHFEKFEDHALKVPLQSLRLQEDPVEVVLDSDKFIATRIGGKYCNVFVTFCSQIQTDQFIVIQILKTDPVFISGLRLYIKDLNGSAYLQRKLLYSDTYCKRNDFIVVWLSEDGEIKVIKNDKNALKRPTCFSLPEAKSGQYQLLGDMCGSVEQLRAFIGDRKKAEPFPWKRTINRSVSSALLSYTIDTGSSLSLICELLDDKVIPVDIDFSQHLSTGDVISEEISQPGNSHEDKLCKICIDNAANIVLIPCGHLCLCYECALKMKVRRQYNCPICRSNIQNTQKVYFS